MVPSADFILAVKYNNLLSALHDVALMNAPTPEHPILSGFSNIEQNDFRCQNNDDDASFFPLKDAKAKFIAEKTTRRRNLQFGQVVKSLCGRKKMRSKHIVKVCVHSHYYKGPILYYLTNAFQSNFLSNQGCFEIRIKMFHVSRQSSLLGKSP